MNSPMTTKFDYSLAMYMDLIEVISSIYQTFTVLDYCLAKKEKCLSEKFLIMRHDVDGNMKNALRMARIETKTGILSTYYFRMTPRLFKPTVIRKISELGHEVGYHYEVLSDARGDYLQAHKMFYENLTKLRKIAPVKTACMHGRSFSKHNNLRFWDKYTLEEFGLVAEPYLSIDYSSMFYFTDTGLCWDNYKFNLRDHVNSKRNSEIKSTVDLIRFLSVQQPDKAALLTHTNNWVDNKLLWTAYKSLFFAINNVKYMRKTILKQT